MYVSQVTRDRIKTIVREKGYVISKMLEECGLNTNTLNQISEERGLSSFSLAKIADYLDCSVDYLLCRTENPNSHKTHAGDSVISPEEQQLNDIIRIYNQLDNVGKAKLLIAADEILNKGKCLI